MHIIFAVDQREGLISYKWADELYRYIVGACQNRKHFVYAINGTIDHIHLLVGMHPSDSVSELVQSLKIQSSKWINDKFHHGAFGWQSGFGAFSYSKSMIPAVQKYIESQREHHKRIRFEDELKAIFDKAGIDYKPEYMMKGYADISPT
jgi:REP element-mobilizing transposase RayT